MNKKRLLFVIPTLRLGGAEKALISLLNAIDSERFEVDLCLFEAGGPLTPEVPEHVNIIEADLVTRGMTLEIRYYLKELIKSGNLSAVAVRLWITLRARLFSKPAFSWNNIRKYIKPIDGYYDVAIGYLEGFTDFFVLDKVKAEKKIGWIHSDFSGRELTDEDRKYYNRFDWIYTISELCKDAFIEQIPAIRSKIDIMENLVLDSVVTEKANEMADIYWDEEKIHLVSVGRLEYAKGIDLGVEACRILVDRGLDICWHVYGEGSWRDKIEKLIKENNLEDTFVLEGQVLNPYPYMKKADIIVQPSRWEGKSIVLDEAKIIGKAIVVTDYPSVVDQIIHGENGYIAAIEPVSIADGIEVLINDEEMKHRLEDNALSEENRSIAALEKFYRLIEE